MPKEHRDRASGSREGMRERLTRYLVRLREVEPKRWLFPGLALLALLYVSWFLIGRMKQDVWAYYTDDAGTRVEVQDGRARPVLWEDPSQNRFDEKDPSGATSDPVNLPGSRLEATFSPSGTLMVLVRGKGEGGNADMYLSRWDGRVWSRPEAIAEINTAANERGPAFSRDGKLLYFASDREGGLGGYDLYAVPVNGRGWGKALRLGDEVNSYANESGPAPSADDSYLFFSSDRDGVENIFAAEQLAPAEKKMVVTFAAAEEVGHLNSKSDDVQAALTGRGDHVFLASDRDRDKQSGFGLYLSRVVDGEALRPERVDLYFGEGDTTDPAVRMDGFDLLFSVGEEGADEEGAAGSYSLYRSTTREVMGYTDLSRWGQFKELMGNIAWWLLIGLVALIGLIYLLEKWRDISSLYHKCLAASGGAHLLALLVMTFWFIAQELEEATAELPPEIEISIDALAQEELAMESVPEEADVSDPEVAMVAEKQESEFDIPELAPQDSAEVAPIEASAAKEMFEVEVRPVASEQVERPAAAAESSLLSELSETVLPQPDSPQLEERQQEVAANQQPAPSFEPQEISPAENKAEPTTPADTAPDAPVEVAKVETAEPIAPSEQPSALSELQPAELEQSQPDASSAPAALESAMLSALPDAAPADAEAPQLEEAAPSELAANTPPADASKDQFTPAEAAPKFESSPAESRTTSDAAMSAPSEAVEVAEAASAATESVSDVRPAEVGEASSDATAAVEPLDAGAIGSLPELALVDSGAPQLEEGGGDAAGERADPGADDFSPNAALPNLASAQSEGNKPSDEAVASESDVAEVAKGSLATSTAIPDHRPSTAAGDATAEEVPLEMIEPGAIAALPDLSLDDPGAPRLEEAAADPHGAPADPSKDMFEPKGSTPKLSSVQTEAPAAPGDAMSKPAETTEIAANSAALGRQPSEVKPSEVGGSPAEREVAEPALGAPALDPLPELATIDPGAPRLEEAGGQPVGAPADEGVEQFKPTASLPNLASAKIQGEAKPDSAVAQPSATTEVAAGNPSAARAPTEVRPADITGDAADGAEAEPAMDALAKGDLPELEMGDPGAPKLEEQGAANAVAAGKEGKEAFEPGAGVPKLATSQASGAVGAGRAEGAATEAAEIAGQSSSKSNTALAAQSGIESQRSHNDVGGAGEIAPPTLVAAGLALVSAPLLPGELEEMDGELSGGDLAKIVKGQRGKPSLETVRQLGGSDGTEKAIGAAIEWLSKNQEADGRWSTRKHGAKSNYDPGGTGLALLCYFGWGARHDVAGDYQDNVRRALDWLTGQQKANGDLGGDGLMYCHAIATIALCEAYGITRDQKLRGHAERALAYSINAQSPSRGGWRYNPGQDSDTSITGWQFMALHSARMAGIDVPDKAFDLARKRFDHAGGGKHGGLYGYQAPGKNSPAMVATGMFCRQLDLMPPGDPMMAESASLLKMHPMRTSKPDLYYIYYSTLALYQHQGPIWDAWNEQLKEILPNLQEKTGSATGSWDPSRGLASAGGRVASTAMATLSLEVYYRLLPMYGFRSGDDAPPAKEKQAR